MASTFEPIATTTVAGTTGTITFNSIPNTYTDLRLVYSGSNSASSYFYLRYNSDTGFNYSDTVLYGNGSVAGSEASTNVAYLYLNSNISIAPDTMVLITADIFSYAGSTFKTSLNTNSNDKNGSGVVERIVGLWRSTSAITSITFSTTNTGNFTGTATLYGIKKA